MATEEQPTAQPGAEPNTIVVDNAQVTQPTKTTFGFDSMNKQTPAWARNVFDLYFILSKAIIGWIAATKMIPAPAVIELTFFITLLLDPVVRGLTKMVGVTVDVPDGLEKS